MPGSIAGHIVSVIKIFEIEFIIFSESILFSE